MSQPASGVLAATAANARVTGGHRPRRLIVCNANAMRNAMGNQKTSTVPQRRGAKEPAAQWFGLFLAWIDAWFTTCRAYYRAAVAYEELYRLSDAELRQHNTSRRTLARDVTGFDVTHHVNF
jgi:hypothetical protein